jgi:hypothetical protein
MPQISKLQEARERLGGASDRTFCTPCTIITTITVYIALIISVHSSQVSQKSKDLDRAFWKDSNTSWQWNNEVTPRESSSSWLFMLCFHHARQREEKRVSNNPFSTVIMIQKRSPRAKQHSRSRSCYIVHISCSYGQEVFKRRPNPWKVRRWLHRYENTARTLREGICQTMMVSSLWDLRCAGVRVCICWRLLTRIKRWWSGLRWCVRMVAL